MIRLCGTCDGYGDVVADVQPEGEDNVVLEPCPDCNTEGIIR